ncbi:MAG TPA: protein kinase [Ktedonobacteraceae bacterium]|nr:protein kinase [Ktedonobacteraceae bacterium]
MILRRQALCIDHRYVFSGMTDESENKMSLEGTQLGHYRLTKWIGGGGMGDVYRAQDTRNIYRQVAIKVVRSKVESFPNPDAAKEAARLFQREMKAITKLDHPHILPLYDFGEESIQKDTVAYMVMPLRPEGSLADWLQDRDSTSLLSFQEVAHIVEQAADALEHAHSNQLVHQDVKPSNFLIRYKTGTTGLPDLLLADFGIAKFMTATATASQTVRGTPTYMAPEQWGGEPVAASDQYALAIMAYQLLTGRPPFVGRMEHLMSQHLMTQPEAPSTLRTDIPPAIDAIILHALEKNPQERFASIKDFSQAFQQAVTGNGDLHATLTISQDEARRGVRRTVTLPGGRKVPVTIQAGTQDGQELRLGGQGEPYYSGGPKGTLILTVVVARKQEEATLPPIPLPKPAPRIWFLTSGMLVVAAIIIGASIYGMNLWPSPSTAAFNAITTLDPSLLATVSIGNANGSAFKTVNGAPPVQAKPQFFYESADNCWHCVALRWTVIIALSRFGTFTTVPPSLTFKPSSRGLSGGDVPTYTFRSSVYQSQYIDFVSVDVLDSQGNKLDTLTPAEQKIVNTYDAPPYTTYTGPPFISVANQYLVVGVPFEWSVLAGKSYFDIVNQVKDPSSDIAKGILGSANYLTAMICQVTQNQPPNVCTAAPIPEIQQKL